MKSFLRNIVVWFLSFSVFYLGAGVSFVHVCSELCTHTEACHGLSAHEDCCCLSDVSYDCPQWHARCSCVDYSCQIDYFITHCQTDACLPVLFPVDLPDWSSCLVSWQYPLPWADSYCSGAPPLPVCRILALLDTYLI